MVHTVRKRKTPVTTYSLCIHVHVLHIVYLLWINPYKAGSLWHTYGLFPCTYMTKCNKKNMGLYLNTFRLPLNRSQHWSFFLVCPSLTAKSLNLSIEEKAEHRSEGLFVLLDDWSPLCGL